MSPDSVEKMVLQFVLHVFDIVANNLLILCPMLASLFYVVLSNLFIRTLIFTLQKTRVSSISMKCSLCWQFWMAGYALHEFQQ